MYQKYQTEALVLGSREQGESDRVFALYTKDFGLVRARASAVRKESSRMRYALQHYSHAQVALVRGKRGWRLGGATMLGDRMSLEGAVTFARTARLVLRLVAGEEQNDYLFAALSEARSALSKSSQETFPTIEIVCVARILFALGYLSSEALQTTLFAHAAYAERDLVEAAALREKLLSSINRAITESHL
ncbi:recombination protein O N-terminal domain-containing protein [Candidatus Kaiserbacteria bacterium]|nr:recombination protein O N-terminal domain-containing protein [Candidatus Kaiserbacteria bacterium]